MTPSRQPKQLRLIIETDDFDKALRFYRDVLGLTEQPAFATDGEDRVSILNVDAATIELATPTHVRNIDAIENAPAAEGPVLRIALEVDSTEAAMSAAEEYGPMCSRPQPELRSKRLTEECKALPAGK